MKTNALDTALARLEALDAQVVETCADSTCEICHPVLELAA
jgi:hypothetical protein